MSSSNVSEIWKVANATNNMFLEDKCVACDAQTLMSGTSYLQMNFEEVCRLLSKPQLSLPAEILFADIVLWIEDDSSDCSFEIRKTHLPALLQYVDFNFISKLFLRNFFMGDTKLAKWSETRYVIEINSRFPEESECFEKSD